MNWADWEIGPNVRKLGYKVKISHVELSKDNIVWIPFLLDRLIYRKLHYMRGVMEYNVLRVVKRFTFGKRIYFNSALSLVYPQNSIWG